MGKQIIVLGMHRSGTSVVTHLIHRMGAYFGEIDEEMRPSEDNPKGFWERRDVVDLNDALLHHAGSSWFKINNLHAGRLEASPELEQNIKSVLANLENKTPWVAKDPRFSFTFSVWKKFLESPVLVVPFRSPLEVAKSLQKRNHFPIEFSLALWQHYMVSAIKSAHELPVIFIEYEKLIADPVGQTKLLYQALIDYGVHNLRLPSQVLINDIIDPTLKHASTAPEKERDQLTKSQLALLDGLRKNNIEILNTVVQLINLNDNRQVLESWEPKIEELLERVVSKVNRITSTLYTYEDDHFSLKNAIRITQNTHAPDKTLKFQRDLSFQPEQKIRLDVVDDICIFQLKSIVLCGNGQEIQIDVDHVTSNAFYEMGSYFFFDQVPSSIFFSLPTDIAPDLNANEIIVNIELLGKGIAVLPHVNQFHKNFSTYSEESEKKELKKIEELILALTTGKDRALKKAQMQIAQLEKNIKLSETIQSLQDQNKVQLELINRITTNYDRKIKKIEDLTIGNIKIKRELNQEKNRNADLQAEIESALSEKEQGSNEIGQLQNSVAEKDAQIAALNYEITSLVSRNNSLITHFENEITNIRGSLSYQVGRIITFPVRLVFDLLTNKKPFNQTQLWWIKQHILHPNAIFGNTEERNLLKKDWASQRATTAELLRIEQGRTTNILPDGSENQSLIPENIENEIAVPASENHNRKKILYISPNLPDFDNSSGGKRATRMLGLLSEAFDVYAFSLGSKPQKYINELERSGVIVIKTVDHREVRRKLPQIHAIIYAWYETYFSSAAFRHLYPDAKIIVDSVDVHWVREKRSIGIWQGLTLDRVAANQKREIEAYENADIVWAVTETDKEAILLEVPRADIRVVSNIHELVLQEFTDNHQNTMLFIGGYNHYPNVSAAKLLAQEIFPKVRASVPDAQLIIAGANAPIEVEELSNIEGVTFKGFIEEEEIEALYADSFLTVSPLLAGAGIKGKICESIAYMTPVVTNEIGNEGIDLIHEEEGLVGPIENMPGIIIKALERKYDLEAMTKNAQDKLIGLVGPGVVKERMVNSILPEISICIVTWNRKELVKRCIESIEGNTIYPNYKILVHSNGCTDGTQDYLKAAAAINPKIVPILSAENDVFVLPNNWMMERFPENDVVLVNNDVYVTRGWLSALHETAYSSADYGIVGSKILYPDGRLQEFGSELYADGTGRNIGKFDDPNKEEYKKQAEVGYVSGCSMYIKRNTINIIGVFDEHFHPCYCEDSDYCYTAKEHGLKTVVTPNSVIFHDEGGTSGTDTSSGMKRYQVINMEKFLNKHRGKTNGITWPKKKKKTEEVAVENEFYKDLDLNLVSSWQSYKSYAKEMESEYVCRLSVEKEITEDEASEFLVSGFNILENDLKKTTFKVIRSKEGKINFRESFVCQQTHLNSRLRATYAVIDYLISNDDQLNYDSAVYFTEQTTSFFSLLNGKFKNLVGSEYLGEDKMPGFINEAGLRHEDLTNLSFKDRSFDLIVSLEVLEHVPDFEAALSEISRVLNPGGYFVFTVPFIFNNQETIVRAEIDEYGEINHLLEPEYHGDPVKVDGILCFYHYGWDLIEHSLKRHGMSGKVAFLWSEEYCIFGKDVGVFIGKKLD